MNLIENKLQVLLTEFARRLVLAQNVNELEQVRIDFLGRSGQIS